jgi:hypothetical protein
LRTKQFIGTFRGIGMGAFAIVVWMLTFEPHGGVELSRFLFPLNPPILDRLYPTQAIPVPVWSGAAFLLWVVLGAVVDCLRRVLAISRRGVNRK